jgi:hypothetical protein
MRIYYAYEILCRDKAGLALCGQDDDGDLEWVGTREKWAEAERLESYYEQGLTPPEEYDFTGSTNNDR